MKVIVSKDQLGNAKLQASEKPDAIKTVSISMGFVNDSDSYCYMVTLRGVRGRSIFQKPFLDLDAALKAMFRMAMQLGVKACINKQVVYNSSKAKVQGVRHENKINLCEC